MNSIDWLDEYPADLRMSLYLEDIVSGEDRETRLNELAKELGYAHRRIIQAWVAGKSKIPLKALMTIASHIGRDVSELVPLWIAQEMKDEDGGRLYQASKRWLSAWEFGLIATARDIYEGDADHC